MERDGEKRDGKGGTVGGLSLETTRRYGEPSPHDLVLAVELIGEDE